MGVSFQSFLKSKNEVPRNHSKRAIAGAAGDSSIRACRPDGKQEVRREQVIKFNSNTHFTRKVSDESDQERELFSADVRAGWFVRSSGVYKRRGQALAANGFASDHYRPGHHQLVLVVPAPLF